jgi:hypothetical protein
VSHPAGASHQPEPDRILQPVERDENAQRSGHDGDEGTSIVKVMEVPSGEHGRSSRGQMLQTLDAQLNSVHSELAYRADSAIRELSC